MTQTLDAILEIFTWVGFGAAVAFGIAAVAVCAADGTWLPAEAYLDDDGATARWVDGDREVNSVALSEHEREHFGADHRADIWYRHGWHDRMRLTRRPPHLKLLIGLAAAGLALGVVASAASIIAFFFR